MHSYCGASFINAMHEMCASNKSHGQLLWKVLSKTKFVTWKSIKQMADLLFSLDHLQLTRAGTDFMRWASEVYRVGRSRVVTSKMTSKMTSKRNQMQ
eukprot:scaffold18104_cov80-Skeletonema_marinoi.AAC.1